VDKRKIFSFLSILGALFIIPLIFGYVQLMNKRGEVIENSVAPDASFEDEFYKVTTRQRAWPMPDASFLGPDGAVQNWQNFDGSYLLVNFWATWCAPCVVELPSLDRLRKKFAGQGLEVIAISLDQRLSHDEINRFLTNRGISNFAAYWDQAGEIQGKITINGIPTSYLLDPEGNILNIFEGDADWSSPESVRFFNEVIGR
jgi:thiol-disulfide isomerase/thioredoxin